MIQFKTCGKCHGDLYFQEDMHGPFWQCLQCGLLRDLAPAAVQEQLPVSYRVTTRRVAS